MNKLLSAFFLTCLWLVLPGCHTYQIATVTVPTNLYSTTGNSYSTIPAGTVLLLKGKPNNAIVQVRYHTDPTWYNISNTNLSPIPNVNPKSYIQRYTSLELTNPAGITPNAAYDATIQTGPRGGKYYINKNGKKTYVKRSSTAGSTKSVGGKGSRGGRH